MSKIASLTVFVLAVVGGGLLIGYATLPGEWYSALNRPWFTPPNWLFAPVWTILYVMIAVAGWRCWNRDRNSVAMTLWFVQMALNFLWSPVFFGLHQPAAALLVVIASLAAILTFVAAAWRRDRMSAVLFLPYAVWTGYATLLNAAVVRLN